MTFLPFGTDDERDDSDYCRRNSCVAPEHRTSILLWLLAAMLLAVALPCYWLVRILFACYSFLRESTATAGLPPVHQVPHVTRLLLPTARTPPVQTPSEQTCPPCKQRQE